MPTTQVIDLTGLSDSEASVQELSAMPGPSKPSLARTNSTDQQRPAGKRKREDSVDERKKSDAGPSRFIVNALRGVISQPDKPRSSAPHRPPLSTGETFKPPMSKGLPQKPEDNRENKKSRSKKATPEPDVHMYFFEDAKPRATETTMVDEPNNEPYLISVDGLLLPRHVTLAQGGPGRTSAVEEADVGNDSSDTDSTLYDDERTTSIRRYWMPDVGDESLSLCRKCGEDDHFAKDCPHEVCNSCGAIDDHSWERCPIFVTCFRCGERGHQAKECRNPPARRKCELCDSANHLSKFCHSIWRQYTYLPYDMRMATLEFREEVKDKPLLDGGEAWVGREIWCFNCAEQGHWGYDCENLSQPLIKRGPCAFSDTVQRSGPFSSAKRYIDERIKAPRRDYGYGPPPPSRPGAQGKQKQNKRMQEAFRRQEQDEGDDWFDRPRPKPNSPSKSNQRSDGRRDRDRRDDHRASNDSWREDQLRKSRNNSTGDRPSNQKGSFQKISLLDRISDPRDRSNGRSSRR